MACRWVRMARSLARSCLALALCGLLMTHTAAAQAPATQTDSTQRQADIVAGRVVSATDGHPLSHARVTLVDITNERLAATADADDSGRFHFDPIANGKYRMTALAVGYTSASYLPHDQYSTAIVTSAGLPTSALELRLTPTSSIAGKVSDDNGDPVPHALVQLYRETPADPVRVTRGRSTQTDDDGGFTLDHLPSGRYFMSVSGSPWYAVPSPLEQENQQMPYRAAVDPALDVAYPTVFYPHALDSAEATPITLRGGEQLNLAMQLQAQHALTLSLRLTPGQDGNARNDQSNNQRNNQRFPQITRSVFGIDEPVNAGGDGNNDIRRMTGIAPGRYKLQEFPNGSGFAVSTRPLDLGTSSMTLDLPPVADLATVAAAVHTADSTPLPANLQFSLRSAQSTRVAGNRITDKGTAEVPNIPPGDYALAINGSRRMNVVRLTLNGKPVPDKHLHVNGAGTLAVDVTVSPTEVQVEGYARRAGKPVAASMIVLVPAGADTDADLFRRDQTDLDGSFSLAGVIPGNYILIAIDDGWELPWTNLTTLAPYLLHGVPVTISATGPSRMKLPEAVPAQPR